MLRNITLSAEESTIAAARERARQEHTTLNAMFREWLMRYAEQDKQRKNREGEARVRAFRELMKRLEYVQPGRKFSRDELNER